MTHTDSPLQVFVFNVGQGDHILLHLPDGSYGIIDSFYDTRCNPLQEPPGLTYLKDRHKKKEHIRIRFLHLSHYHRDHFKGLRLWLNWIEEHRIPVDYLLMPGTDSTDIMKESLLNIVGNKDVLQSLFKKRPDLTARINSFKEALSNTSLHVLDKYKRCLEKNEGNTGNKDKNGEDCMEEYLNAIHGVDIYNENPPVLLYCIAPLSKNLQKFIKQSPEVILETFFGEKGERSPVQNQNDISTVLLLRFGEHVLTFGSDAEIESLEASIKQLKPSTQDRIKGDFSSNFIKIFHHGARYSSSETVWQAFLKEKDDVHIAISAGTHRKYNHPHKETIDDLTKVAERQGTRPRIYPTNRDHLSVNGDDIPITPVPDTLTLWRNRPSNKVGKRIAKKTLLLDNSPVPQSDKVRQRNQRYGHKIDFLGYQFEFWKGESRVKVKEMVSV